MKRSSLLTAAYLLDLLVGDPEDLPHPVCFMGWTIERGERLLRSRGFGRNFDITAGATLAVAVPAVSALTAHLLIRGANLRNRVFGAAVEIWLASTCLATRNLLDEATKVLHALECDDLVLARRQLSRIVGRDTDSLDESEICRALIETLAESLNDGIIAPLFYLAMGGVPAAMAYKAINTLDSMIGHRNERYIWFGRTAARFDDAANWIPARISALLLCVVAATMDVDSAPRAARIWLRDGSHHASPNAGQPESAMAGALGVRLGGTNTYCGEVVHSPHLGGELSSPSRKQARQALYVTAAASVFAFTAFFLIRASRRDG